MMRKLITLGLLLLPLLSFSQTIAGKYLCKGVDQKGQASYEGTTYITQSGQVYHVIWQYNDGTKYSGIGLLYEDVFSVIFAQPNGNNKSATNYGVQQYVINGNALNGHWVFYGQANQVGKEICVKMD